MDELDRTAKLLAGTSLSEAAVAAGAAVLAILGLVGVSPTYMAPIATIGLGASLLVEGAGHAARIAQLRALAHRHEQAVGVAGGVSSEVAGGIAGIALGTLALLGMTPIVLQASAVIVFGGTLLLSGGTEAESEALIARYEGRARDVEYMPVQVVNSAGTLIGIGATVLGVLVLSGVEPALTLLLVALLGVGSSLALSGSTLGAEMGLVARRH